jgi:ketosteroid isomerase-like protein
MTALTDQHLDEIRELCEEKWVSPALTRDWGANMALCTEDFVYMPPDHPVLHGTTEARAYLDAFPELTSFSQQLVDVVGDTELAAIQCTFAGTFIVDEQELSGVGKCLVTASRQSGEWLLSAACFNWDTPPSPNE